MSFKKTIRKLEKSKAFLPLGAFIAFIVAFFAVLACAFVISVSFTNFLHDSGGVRGVIIDAGREVKSIVDEINQ